MGWLIAKALISGVLIAIISELGKRQPAFAGQLDDAAMRQIHAYVRARARESLGTRAAPAATPTPQPPAGGAHPRDQPKVGL